MIISRTPFRISLFGGGTDYPKWYQEHGGAVVATAIDKYCYLTCRFLPPYFEHRFRIVWSKIENCQRIEEITHPAVKAVLSFLKMEKGVEIHHDGDLPARSGIGSSSAFAVGLLHALYALQGEKTDKRRLACESIRIEQDFLQEQSGLQDQITTSHGGFNYIEFDRQGRFSVSKLGVGEDRLEELLSYLVLLYPGILRSLNRPAVPPRFHEKKNELHLIRKLVDDSVSLLLSGKSLAPLGEMMTKSWFAKRDLSQDITSPEVDAVYRNAIEAGALGGKLLGAGGGGFMLFVVPPEKRSKFLRQMEGSVYTPFQFDSMGSQIIFNQSQEGTLAHEWKNPRPNSQENTSLFL